MVKKFRKILLGSKDGEGEKFVIDIGEIIKHYREKKGYTQSKLADISGVSKETISRYEHNKRIPHLLEIIAISDALGFSMDIFKGE